MTDYGLTYNEAERAYLAGRMTAREWRRYTFVWTWSAARLGGVAGMAQDRYTARFGYPALLRRRARVQRAFLGIS